jgi:transposase
MEQVGLPRSDLGKAVRYMLERWTGLTRFLDNPCIPFDNNAAERVLRGPVVGSQESLRVEVAARHAGRRPLLHPV